MKSCDESTPAVLLAIKKCQGMKTNITRNLKFRKPEPAMVTKAHDFSHRSLLQMQIFHLVCNEVFGVFSKCKRFQAPSGLTQCLLLM